MTTNLEEIGLSSIVYQFDLFFIDIWGVVHNGIKLYPDAINVLERLNDKNKDYVLLTNAPRPNSTVINFLKNNLPSKSYYHGVHHTQDVFQSLDEICFYEKVKPDEYFLLKTAVLFHDMGYIDQYKNNENLGVKYAEQTLPKFNSSFVISFKYLIPNCFKHFSIGLLSQPKVICAIIVICFLIPTLPPSGASIGHIIPTAWNVIFSDQ